MNITTKYNIGDSVKFDPLNDGVNTEFKVVAIFPYVYGDKLIHPVTKETAYIERKGVLYNIENATEDYTKINETCLS